VVLLLEIRVSVVNIEMLSWNSKILRYRPLADLD